MSKQHYVEDNEGSGFATDDDADVDSLLDFAASSVEEDDEGDTSIYFGSNSGPVEREPTKRKERRAPEKEVLLIEEDEEITPVNLEESTIVYTSETEVEPEITPVQIEDESYEEEVTPIQTQEPEPIKSRWAKQPDDQQSFVKPSPGLYSEPEETRTRQTNRLNIPTEAEQIAFASKVLKVIDIYRQLKSDEKSVACQLITQSDEKMEDEAVIAIKVLTADSMLPITMTSLREAKQADDVERVFYLISLDESVLYNLGSIVSAFANEDIDENLGKIDYVRALVKHISQMDGSTVKYITSTESLLAAAHEKNE